MMVNDPLIEQFVTDLRPVRRRSLWRDALTLAVLAGVEIGAVLGFGLMRPDMPHAMHMMSFWWKAIGLLLIVGLGVASALVSLDPTRSPRQGLRRLGVTALVLFALGWLVDALQAGPEALWLRLDPAHGMVCARKIVELALPAVLALGVIVRRGAPVDVRGTAWVTGIAGAAFGALVFALACPFDDPLYLVVWYSLACALVACSTRLVLPWLIRW